MKRRALAMTMLVCLFAAGLAFAMGSVPSQSAAAIPTSLATTVASSAPAQTPPGSPSWVWISCSADGATLTVGWEAGSGATGYEAEEDGGDLPSWSGTATSFTRTSTPGQSYRWRVRSTGPSNTTSAWTGWSYGECPTPPAPTPTPTPVPAPEVPTGLSAVLGSDNASIDVAWTAPTGVDGVELHISSASNPSTPFTQEFASTHTPDANGIMHTYPATAGETYSVKVRSYKTGSDDTKTHSDWASTTSVHIPPAVPTGLTATLGSDNASIEISWTAPTSATGVELSIASQSNPPVVFTQEFASTHTPDANGIMHTHQATAGESYDVKVRSYKTSSDNTKTHSDWTPTTSVHIPPPVPTGLTAALGTNNASIVTSWTAPSSADGVELRIYSVSTLDALSESFIASTQTSHTYSGVTAGEVYVVLLRAYDSVNGDKVYSKWADGVVVSAPTTVPVPTGTSSTVASDNSSITFSWTVPSGADGVDLQITTGFGLSVLHRASFASTQTSYTHSSVTAGETYVLRLRSYKTTSGSKTYSEWIVAAVATVPEPANPIPEPLAGFAVLGSNNTSIEVAWIPHSEATGVDISITSSSSEVYRGQHQASRPTYSYSTHTYKASSGSTYVVSLRSYKVASGGSTQYSDWMLVGLVGVPGIPLSGAPSTPVVSCVAAADSITWSWPAVSGATKYLLSHGGLIGEEQTTRSKTYTELLAGARFRLFVQSGNVTGWSSPHSATCDVPLGGPTSVSASLGSDNQSVKAAWTAASASTTGVQVRVVDTSDQTEVFKGFKGSVEASSHSFTGSPGKTYAVSVRSYLANPLGNVYSAWVSAESVTVPSSSVPAVSCTATSSSIMWSWPAVTGATNYRTSSDDSTWTEQTGLSKSTTGLSAGASATLYVQAYSQGTWSDSDSATCTTVPPETVVSCSADADSITWTWPAVSGATKYQTRFDLGGQLGAGQWSEQTGLSKTSEDLSAGASLKLDVQAGNAAGWSSTDSATCTTVPPDPVVSCTSTSTSITWSWPAVTGATNYRTSSDNSTWSEQTGRSKTSSSLSAGTSLTLDVQAGNAAGWSGSGSATCTTIPGAPSVSCTADADSITWSWTAVSGATKYRTRFDLGGQLGVGQWSEQTETSRERDELSAGASLKLDVQAGNAGGWSSTDSETCTTTLPIPPAPTVSCTADADSITWTWPAASRATKYRTSSDDSTWSEQSGRSKTSDNLSAGTSLTLYVQVGNAAGWSGSGSATCTTIPGTPSVSCTADADSITWTWPAVSGATKYQTRFDLGGQLGAGQWSEQTGRSKTSDNLSAGASLKLDVQAGNAAGWSGSDSATCTTIPGAPSVSCTADADSITWTWPAASGATKYRTGFVLGPWVEQNTRTKTSSNLSAGFAQLLFVQAGNASGWSGSGSATCTTIPGAPSVSCTSTSTSITWSWATVTGATKYRTRFYLGQDLGYGDWSEQTERSKTSSGLSSGDSSLTLYAQAGNAAGWSSQDGATCTTTPAAPDVSCTSTASSITWTWPAVTGATNYRTSFNRSTWTEQTTRSKASTGLDSDTTQTLYVQAGNSGGWSTSDSAACTTSSTGK